MAWLNMFHGSSIRIRAPNPYSTVEAIEADEAFNKLKAEARAQSLTIDAAAHSEYGLVHVMCGTEISTREKHISQGEVQVVTPKVPDEAIVAPLIDALKVVIAKHSDAEQTVQSGFILHCFD